MFSLIRKYQHFLFCLIATVVIGSLLFFGTFSLFDFDEPPEDPMIGHTVTGDPFTLSEVKTLSRFLSSDREDLSAGGSLVPNLCNDGVIRYDLLKSGIAHFMVQQYFSALQKDLSSRLEKGKQFTPYVHSKIPFIQAVSVWKEKAPSLLQNLEAFQGQTEVGVETFDLLSTLYQEQALFPSEKLRHSLVALQRQYPAVSSDPRLQYADFSLFGFHSLSDWLGQQFLDLSSQFILNGASIAEEKGYQVSLEEAKADLALNFQRSLNKFPKSALKQLPSLKDHLRLLGFDMHTASQLWRKVLLFRRYFQGISQSALMDRLPFKDFASYAKEEARLDVYQWPASLRLKTLEELLEFQIYLSLIAPKSSDPLLLPSVTYTPDEVRKRSMRLVPTEYAFTLQQISLAEVSLQVPLQETLKWQLDEENWKILEKKFLFLSQASNRQERLQGLARLRLEDRVLVDLFAKEEWIRRHPDWLIEALSRAPVQQKRVLILPDSVKWPFELLRKAASGIQEAQEALRFYSLNDDLMYRFQDIKMVGESILTWSQAKQEGVLKELANDMLQEEYLRLKEKKGKKHLTFEAVKEELIRHALADVLQKIESLDTRDWTEKDYLAYRFLEPTRLALKEYQYSQDKKITDPLLSQFQMEKQERIIYRSAEEEFMKNAFTMNPGDWSSVTVSSFGEISFFYLAEKTLPETPILEQMLFSKEALGFDAQRYVAVRMLERLKAEQVIVLPINKEKHESF